MKNFIVSLFLSGVFFTACNAYAEDIILSGAENLVFKTENGQEVVYNKKGDLYNGAVALPDSENRRVIYIYSNGKKHGDAFSKFSSDKIELKIPYTNGMKNGDEVSFYQNGNPRYKKTYVDDIQEGEEAVYYPNGKLQKLSHYVNGKLDGTIDYFDENGNRIRTETYKNGVKDGPERIIANNMLREEIQFVNGKREGIYKTYSSEGSWREIPFKNDKKEGEGKIFSPNKVLLESVVYANNKRNGMYKKFSLTGRLISSENYKDDQKDGIARYFDNKGKLSSVSYFMDGSELANVQIAKRIELQNLQDALFDGQLSKYSNKKTLWYRILWLGLNLEDPEVLDALEKEMRMFAYNIDEMPIYERWSGSLFDNENKQLFFGLPPLDYAINIEAPTEILQKFVSQTEEKNLRGNTALRDAVRLNKENMVKFLLLNNANLKDTDEEGNDILLYSIINGSPHEITEDIVKAGGNVNTKNSVGQTPLSVALAQRDTELVKFLIDNGANIENMPDGQNLLHYAYDKKVPLEVITELLTDGVDINSTDSDGNNLLLKALKNGDEETALYALDHNADINQKDNEGETAVSYVLFNKVPQQVSDRIFALDYDVINNLEKQNKMVWKVLMEQNKIDLLKKTWDRMPDITTTADVNGEIPLKTALSVPANPKLHELALSYIKKADDKMVWDALKQKDLSLFRDLLGKQANINAQDDGGNTLLMYMIMHDYDDSFLSLIKNKDLIIDKENNNNQTALDIALDKNNLEMAKYLLDAGADPIREVDGENYISKATPAQSEQVSLLLQYVKAPDTKISNDVNISLRAVKNLNFPLLKYLVDNNLTDFNITDENGNTLMLCIADYFEYSHDNDDKNALAKKAIEIAQVLLDKGQDINARNGNGETLLTRLAKYCGDEYDEMAKFLIENGASTKMRDQYNKNADDYRSNGEEQTEDTQE